MRLTETIPHEVIQDLGSKTTRSHTKQSKKLHGQQRQALYTKRTHALCSPLKTSFEENDRIEARNANTSLSPRHSLTIPLQLTSLAYLGNKCHFSPLALSSDRNVGTKYNAPQDCTTPNTHRKAKHLSSCKDFPQNGTDSCLASRPECDGCC